MTSFKLGFRLFAQNSFINSLLALELLLVFLLCGSLTAAVSFLLQAQGTLSASERQRFVYYMPNTNRVIKDAEIFVNPKGEALMNKYPELISVGHAIPISFETDAEDLPSHFTLRAYNSEMINGVKPKMRDGSWFTKDAPEGCIPLVVTDSNISVGTIINAYNRQLSVEIRFYVTGVAASPFYYFDSGRSGDRLGSNDILELYRPNGRLDFTGVFNYEQVKEFEYEKIDMSVNRYLYFQSGIDEEVYSNYTEELKLEGHIADSTSISEVDYEYIIITLKNELPEAVCLFIISLVSLMSITVMNISRMMPTFGLYSICGCSKKMNLRIISIYIAIITVVSLIASFIFMIFCKQLNFEYFPVITVSNFYVLFTLSLFIYIVTMVFVILRFKKRSLRKIIRA